MTSTAHSSVMVIGTFRSKTGSPAFAKPTSWHERRMMVHRPARNRARAGVRHNKPMSEVSLPDPHEITSFEAYFRDPGYAPEQPLAWALSQRLDVLDALRGLFNGPHAMVRLRLWCFMELAAQPKARLSREDLNQLFHAVLPEALDTVLKRLRDLDLLVWDATPQDYHLSPLAQQVHGLLAPLTTPPAAEHDEMASLL